MHQLRATTTSNTYYVMESHQLMTYISLFYHILGVNRQYSYGDVTDFNPLSGKYESTAPNHPYASTGMVHYPPSSAKLTPREDGDGESTLPV